MTALEDIRAAVAELREVRRAPGRGRALYDLNLWKGAQRKALDEEYQRRLAEIEDMPDSRPEDRVSPKVLGFVAEAVAQGYSRSNIRKALGLAALGEADEIIAMAGGYVHEQIATGDAKAYTLRALDSVHSRGWPMYAVTLLETGESYAAVYLVTSGEPDAVDRRHLRIQPSPPGSVDILDRIFASGAAEEIFRRGK